ncbi:sirohydrochlorin chelatase [Thermodesulfobacteriota bacterium]
MRERSFRLRCAFLQFTTPGFQAVVDGLAAEGVTRIVVFPHFIAAGSHVIRDIPALIEKAAEGNPGIEFRLTPHLGTFKGMKGLILEEIGRTIRSSRGSASRAGKEGG